MTPTLQAMATPIKKSFDGIANDNIKKQTKAQHPTSNDDNVLCFSLAFVSTFISSSHPLSSYIPCNT